MVSTFYARWIAGPTSREAPFLPGGRLLCGTGGAPPSLGVYSWCIAVPFGRNRFAGQVRGGRRLSLVGNFYAQREALLLVGGFYS
jgi:hypothetical protein